MAIKYSIQGALIYLAIAVLLLAFTARLIRRRRLGDALYAASFVVVLVAFIYRWIDVRHVPMQNLFEVFVCLGMIWPLSRFCRRAMRIGGDTVDMLLGVIVLFPAGFVFNAEPQQLPPALQCWLFAPHVAVYMASYIVMAKAAVQAIYCVAGRDRPADPELVSYEEGTYRLVLLGFPLLTLGLILGSWWGKLAWGDYWGWDPKEMWSLATWLIFAGYLHARALFGRGRARLTGAIAVAGMVAIIITLLWVNLSRLFAGLHNYAS
ncbi:MAG: cytochrome c biogenesis protein CcsA [Verrucomicrobia bacterium]|jgi:ABC-type transport system involved in cytochrome c biogenesis permease subunit|nr:cytochrome c biogenesis protein CcsA [Verrucomicrobiota bacterium]MBT7068433.1 cytochrome c biogenesis protein CcsA [Verrucomicrobiota bacterium]MBT7698999.1 cytochrome c biogenesis protein CcsA [Verrucomicrobiota bacterium]